MEITCPMYPNFRTVSPFFAWSQFTPHPIKPCSLERGCSPPCFAERGRGHQNISPSPLPAPLRGTRPGIRCEVYLKENPVFQYGVRGLLLYLPHARFYGSFYFPLNLPPHVHHVSLLLVFFFCTNNASRFFLIVFVSKL